MAGTIYPGLSRTEVLDLMPEMTLDAEQAEILTEEGWCKLPHPETQEELSARVKLCVAKFKEMAKV